MEIFHHALTKVFLFIQAVVKREIIKVLLNATREKQLVFCKPNFPYLLNFSFSYNALLLLSSVARIEYKFVTVRAKI